ncbi:MAG: 50S ribosomal protein L4 [Planctomycetes bacterium]|nr:50S ribosomal protein L4 [Planctomycetota bacterium]
MIDLPVYSAEGKPSGTVAVDEALFGGKVHARLLRDAVVAYHAHRRQGTVSTRDRGEVEGSTKKMWKQKHTGRARMGTKRSPIWRHGGRVFGPKPRDFRSGMTVRHRHQALDSALLSKFLDKEAAVVDVLSFARPAGAEKPRWTKKMAGLLKSIGIDRTCLIGLSKHDANVHLATRNIRGVKSSPVSEFNAFDVLRYRRLLLTKDGLEALVAARKARLATAAK